MPPWNPRADVRARRPPLLSGAGLSHAPRRRWCRPGALAGPPEGDAALVAARRPGLRDGARGFGSGPRADLRSPATAGDTDPLLQRPRHLAAADRDPSHGAVATAHGRPFRLARDGAGGGADLSLAASRGPGEGRHLR